jgi:hypothetical protein
MGRWDQPWEAATQLGYAHRRLSPPLPTEADGNRTQTASRHRPLRVVPLPRGKPRAVTVDSTLADDQYISVRLVL